MRTVPRLIRIAVATSSGSERMSTTSAVSTATSVPAPIAIPTSARASAGASLTPSPTIAALRPCRCSSAIRSAFSPGRTSANTSSMPTSIATCSAVARLSPVSMTGDTPSSRSAATASRAVPRGASAIASSRGPRVDRCPDDGPPLGGEAAGLGGELARRDPLPLHQPGVADRQPAALDCRERAVAGTLSKASAGGGVPRACASSTTAWASGCSLSRSTAPTSRSNYSSTPGAVTTSTTAGSPRVSVPVLSKTMPHLRQRLERHGGLEEDAAPRPEPGAHHHRHRRRQPEVRRGR